MVFVFHHIHHGCNLFCRWVIRLAAKWMLVMTALSMQWILCIPYQHLVTTWMNYYPYTVDAGQDCLIHPVDIMYTLPTPSILPGWMITPILWMMVMTALSIQWILCIPYQHLVYYLDEWLHLYCGCWSWLPYPSSGYYVYPINT